MIFVFFAVCMALISFAAYGGSMEEPVQFAIIEPDGFDYRWLIAGVIIPVAGLAVGLWMRRK